MVKGMRKVSVGGGSCEVKFELEEGWRLECEIVNMSVECCLRLRGEGVRMGRRGMR